MLQTLPRQMFQLEGIDHKMYTRNSKSAEQIGRKFHKVSTHEQGEMGTASKKETLYAERREHGSASFAASTSSMRYLELVSTGIFNIYILHVYSSL